ncbi:hypothetical protein [Alkaliphilus sp. B6464]|uniref:hypothetical protein n=1 Tax=Alkaliphilus sp. B6464 TaxID=2731219 RepID=UPI001BACBCE0|nr:hypothetical protein [Alkaliphilus sp. B6464]QUH22167.1 hypothetical protein HYG84_19865 [Alkaliphilus sp. B6464]
MNNEIVIKGERVFFTSMGIMDTRFILIRKNVNFNKGKGHKVDICPLCKKEFEIGDKTILVINNNKLFPNVIVHSECLNIIGEEAACLQMFEEYEKAKELIFIWG